MQNSLWAGLYFSLNGKNGRTSEYIYIDIYMCVYFFHSHHLHNCLFYNYSLFMIITYIINSSNVIYCLNPQSSQQVLSMHQFQPAAVHLQVKKASTEKDSFTEYLFIYKSSRPPQASCTPSICLCYLCSVPFLIMISIYVYTEVNC